MHFLQNDIKEREEKIVDIDAEMKELKKKMKELKEQKKQAEQDIVGLKNLIAISNYSKSEAK